MTERWQGEPKTIADFWRALNARATGPAIVTTGEADRPEGFLALSATHFCASPPVMTVAVGAGTSALGTIEKSRCFSINYLSDQGKWIFDRFASRDVPPGNRRFAGLELSSLTTGAPILAETTCVFDCQVEEILERFDTFLLFGRVVAYQCDTVHHPLVFFSGRALGRG